LDSESGSGKDEAGDEANVVVGLVAIGLQKLNLRQTLKVKMRYVASFFGDQSYLVSV